MGDVSDIKLTRTGTFFFRKKGCRLSLGPTLCGAHPRLLSLKAKKAAHSHVRIPLRRPFIHLS